MTERWERELRKLGELEAPASTRDRIAHGPQGQGMPPSSGRGQRILAGVVAFAVFGGAVALALGAFGSGATPPTGGVFAFMDYSKLDGLSAAVIQDTDSSEVLMVGFMNEQALADTRRTG